MRPSQALPDATILAAFGIGLQVVRAGEAHRVLPDRRRLEELRRSPAALAAGVAEENQRGRRARALARLRRTGSPPATPRTAPARSPGARHGGREVRSSPAQAQAPPDDAGDPEPGERSLPAGRAQAIRGLRAEVERLEHDHEAHERAGNPAAAAKAAGDAQECRRAIAILEGLT